MEIMEMNLSVFYIEIDESVAKLYVCRTIFITIN